VVDLADADAARDELITRGSEIFDDQVQAALGPRRGRHQRRATHAESASSSLKSIRLPQRAAAER